MSRCCLSYLLLLLITGITTGCKENNGTQKQPEIAVANSYLLSVVRDLCGEQTDVMSFVPPGMCPGHFDISPAQVKQLSKCKVLFLFDFQSGIGNSMSRLEERGLKIYGIEAPEGLCLPKTYLTVAKSVADALSKDNLARRAEHDRRLEVIEKRLDVLAADINVKIEQAGLKDTKVLVSGHQAEFAKWLGLSIVATFAGSDVETPSRINAALMETKDKNIKLVIANQQEGTALAKALADRLNAKTIVFSNFPAGQGGMPALDSLLFENISGLLKSEQ
jgi:ABC-type Zn uptake system ZnuABC Zn-binding protein ZnuA